MAEEQFLKTLTDDSFTATIEKGIVLVDFYAVWCAPCRVMTPIVEQVSEHFQNKIVVGKVDIDSEQKTSANLQVTSVPTLILFKDGKEFNRLIGLRDFESVKAFVESALE